MEWLYYLIENFGYLAIAVGCMVEGEVALLLGAIAAQENVLWYPGILAAGFAGTVVGNNFWFHLGHRAGQPFINRHRHWRVRARYARRLLERYGAAVIIGLRFFYGIRSVVAVVIGTARVSPLKFFVYDLIGAVLWLTIVGTVMYFLGAALDTALAALDSGRGMLAMGAVGILVFLVVVGLIIWRVRVDRRAQRAR